MPRKILKGGGYQKHNLKAIKGKFASRKCNTRFIGAATEPVLEQKLPVKLTMMLWQKLLES